jgi:hypothetical protein
MEAPRSGRKGLAGRITSWALQRYLPANYCPKPPSEKIVRLISKTFSGACEVCCLNGAPASAGKTLLFLQWTDALILLKEDIQMRTEAERRP